MGLFDTERAELVQAARQLTERGLLMATGGNLSRRSPDGNGFLITPSNRDYLTMLPEHICVLDWELRQMDGPYAPSVESGLHAAVYGRRSDVAAIVHTHQVYASAVSLLKTGIPALFDEQARFLGRSVRLIPYAPSGTGWLAATVAKQVRGHDNAFLMKNHGALSFGHDVERAVHNAEILEKCALAWLLALSAGQKPGRIPLAIREIAHAKLRADAKKFGVDSEYHPGE
ncbi:MAG: class II aldolase/adducin family protein [Spirochaetes bacterium]|nr:class II aldolase/adducin family protein [Spirochaetota bacterium]MBU0954879.1 class II aldolase/adducin family protein [Spirochaetota bacterium]